MPVYRAQRRRCSPKGDSVVVADGEDVLVRELTVYELDGEPVDTGLLDPSGAPLYRWPEPKQFGFIDFDEVS